MRILVTNDDGIHAPGLEVLEAIAHELSDDVWVCAPSDNQTGAGHSLTLSLPVRLRKHSERRFSVTGTPTDAVSMGLKHVMDGAPDLILSGVNAGANLGDDITYSGTVSAAMEGALAGVRSIAMSQVMRQERPASGDRFHAARNWGARVIQPLLDAPHEPRTLVSVNFPALDAEQVQGMRVVRQGFHDYARASIVEARDPRGQRYYWFGLDAIEHTPDHGTDLEAIAEDHISITPLQLDLTHHASLGVLADRFKG
ncbi:5-nucleotidase SurE [Altererythrobacter epoxidivorans]|uniref:5'-nucleotidase SurE n=1 Tax=Altererythrobacter epoxidivorans TaxID=361183 RepID=A0A0M4MWV6_9SPHN|nr:5'/3'-nucleotidase SurE [Altererythrobacter epoxidivorans]ALE17313.1 5-nucleotidase SurE [Altererythrobacter epoxidivorans]